MDYSPLLRPIPRRLLFVGSLSLGLSGCYTLAGAPEIDLAILGAGAAAFGVGSMIMNDDAAPTSTGLDNSDVPKVTGTPSLDNNPQAAFYLQRLKTAHGNAPSRAGTDLFSDQEGVLSACGLGERPRTLLIHRRTPAQLKEDQRNLESQEGINSVDYNDTKVSLLEGSCEDGVIAGEFKAVTYHEMVTTTEHGTSTTHSYQHLTGNMEQGELQGELLIYNSSNTTYSNQPHEYSVNNYQLGIYENSLPLGNHVSYSVNSGNHSTSVREHLTESYARVYAYSGAELTSKSYRKNGILDGWITFYTPPIEGTRECYRNNREIEDTSYCDALELSLSAMTPAEVNYLAMAPEDLQATSM